MVKVDIEYCDSCGHRKQFLELAELIKKTVPTAEVFGIAGRQGSYEIEIDNVLIYSKRQTMAFPEFADVAAVVKEVSEGQLPRTIDKQQPIQCLLM